MFRNQFIKNVLITPFFTVNTITIITNKTDYRIQTKKQAKTCFKLNYFDTNSEIVLTIANIGFSLISHVPAISK
ncbi:Uncharacterised protein [Chlamydia trachomatis]|nr:Uncharacterised protein [Chlamydia trachomatis]CRH46700.1 Uncharacterised protein [Chlamydia trachomatis]CRH55223.1 Uncharacterised protein [Chlamydia trachomatis]